MVAGAVEHPPQVWDSREEGREGEGRAREGKGEKERGGERGGGDVKLGGRRGTSRRKALEEWQGGEIRRRGIHSRDWASFTHTTQPEGVLPTYMQAWSRGKARTG